MSFRIRILFYRVNGVTHFSMDDYYYYMHIKQGFDDLKASILKNEIAK